MAAADIKKQQQQQQTSAGTGMVRFAKNVGGWITIGAMGAGLAMAGGAAVLTVVVIAGTATPLLLFLSPILITIGVVITVATLGTMGAAAAMLCFLVMVSWIKGYLKGRQSVTKTLVDSAGAVTKPLTEAAAKGKAVLVGPASTAEQPQPQAAAPSA